MAVAAPARLRRAPAPAPAPQRRRPPLAVVAPQGRRRLPRPRRPVVLAAGALLASLLAVSGAHAYLVQGQVRLVRLQQQLTSAQNQERRLELQVAQMESPSVVVAGGQSQGLSIPGQPAGSPAGASSSAPSSASSSSTTGG